MKHIMKIYIRNHSHSQLLARNTKRTVGTLKEVPKSMEFNIHECITATESKNFVQSAGPIGHSHQ